MADDELTEDWVRPDTWATFEDLQARSPALVDADRTRAEAFLEDATALIDAELDAAGKAVTEDPGAPYLARLRAVCCRVSLRAMGGAMDGVSGYSLTADVFKESWEYSNPSGDLYLSETDRRELGIASDQNVEQFWPYAKQWGVE